MDIQPFFTEEEKKQFFSKYKQLVRHLYFFLKKEDLSKMKELMKQFRKVSPNIEMNIFRSVENVNVDACIGYVKNGKRHHFLEEY